MNKRENAYHAKKIKPHFTYYVKCGIIICRNFILEEFPRKLNGKKRRKNMSAQVRKVAKKKEYYRGADRFSIGDNVVSFAIGAIIMFSIFVLFMMDKSALQETMKNVTLKKEEIPIVQEKITVQEEKKEETAEEIMIEDKEEPEAVTFYTEENVDLLARLMYAEEGVLLQRQSIEDAELAHKLCGSVILHRTEIGYSGSSGNSEAMGRRTTA